MGNIKVLVRDLETVNFDKICCLALAIVVRNLELGDIVVVSEGDHDIDIEGDDVDREYWKVDGRSMTEQFAIRHELGEIAIRVGLGQEAGPTRYVLKSSPTVGLIGLAALCQSLAENHGKVSGVKGGFLYKKGMIPSYARNLSLVPNRASEIVDKMVKAVAASLKDANPIMALIGAAGSEWDRIDGALASAERAVYEKARDAARALEAGRYKEGGTFDLAAWSGKERPQGIVIETTNPNLMKHMWAALKAMEPNFRVAVAVVSHPETKRIAVLCSTIYPVDIRPVAKALAERFPETEFDVNLERNSIVWDPRSKTPGPTKGQMQEIVSAHLAPRKEERKVDGPRFVGATIGDAFRNRGTQKRR